MSTIQSFPVQAMIYLWIWLQNRLLRESKVAGLKPARNKNLSAYRLQFHNLKYSYRSVCLCMFVDCIFVDAPTEILYIQTNKFLPLYNINTNVMRSQLERQ